MEEVKKCYSLKKKKNVIKVLKFTESQLIIMQNRTNVYPHVKPIILTQLIMGFFFFFFFFDKINHGT